MPESTPAPLEVSVQEVQTLLQSGADFLLLDCRQADEHATASINGSTLIPMNELPERVAELESHRDRQIVVHCHHGGRSMRVTNWLREQGFEKAQNMAGGIDAWSLEIDPSVARY